VETYGKTGVSDDSCFFCYSDLFLTTTCANRYYQIFTRLYAISLLFANELMTNSSWTQAHIKDLLRLGRSTWLAYILNLDVPSSTKQAVNEERCRVVYPPCDTREFLHLPLHGRGRQPTLTSLAQFRPEKDQAKQLQALGILFQKYPKWKAEGVGLVLMGSCRDEVDEARIEGLKELSRTLEIEVNVELFLR
jgi:alpha-1,2-mannosyltransferase